MSPPDALPASALLRRQFRLAHGLIDATIDRLGPEDLKRRPPGTIASAGTCYAQVVLCEDLSVNGVLAAGAPLALSTWRGRSGLSELPELVTTFDWRGWARRVEIDPAALRLYARAVHAATDDYLATLSEDMLAMARGDLPVSMLNALLLTLSMRRGEIACLLALQHAPASQEAQCPGESGRACIG